MRRMHIHEPRHLGDVVADKVTEIMGSWGFIIIQTAILIIWALLNSVAWFVWKWDIYPFIAMNLLLSCQAAYASPLILMSQNRQAAKDRKRDDLESTEVEEMYQNHQLLLKINQQQLEILELLKNSNQDKAQSTSKSKRPSKPVASSELDGKRIGDAAKEAKNG